METQLEICAFISSIQRIATWHLDKNSGAKISTYTRAHRRRLFLHMEWRNISSREKVLLVWWRHQTTCKARLMWHKSMYTLKDESHITKLAFSINKQNRC